MRNFGAGAEPMPSLNVKPQRLLTVQVPDNTSVDVDDVEHGRPDVLLFPALFYNFETQTIHPYVLDGYGDRSRIPNSRRSQGGLSHQHLQRAKMLLSTRELNSITLEKLADACGLSAAHVAREFKKSTGMPPHRWALKHKVSVAKEFLIKNDLTLSTIAVKCGFVDQSHLGRWFKHFTGVSPRTWQRLHADANYRCPEPRKRVKPAPKIK
jgi:AraC-like DNA-binding protein